MVVSFHEHNFIARTNFKWLKHYANKNLVKMPIHRIKKSLLYQRRRSPTKRWVPFKPYKVTPRNEYRNFRLHQDPDKHKKQFQEAWKALKGEWVTVGFGSVRHGHRRRVEYRAVWRRGAWHLARLLKLMSRRGITAERRGPEVEVELDKLHSLEQEGYIESRPKVIAE